MTLHPRESGGFSDHDFSVPSEAEKTIRYGLPPRPRPIDPQGYDTEEADCLTPTPALQGSTVERQAGIPNLRTVFGKKAKRTSQE